MLVLSAIEKAYKGNMILQFTQWSLASGICWVQGANGTGKSTLFRVIAGQTPFDGQVTLNGISLKTEPIKFRSNLSFAEAEPQYPPFISGKELLNFYINIFKASADRADWLCKRFGMVDFLDQKVKTYSSGMLKKLSLILALLPDVSLYLLDEPLITIDVKAAECLYELINELQKAGKTVLVSSHQALDPNWISVNSTVTINNKAIIPC